MKLIFSLVFGDNAAGGATFLDEINITATGDPRTPTDH